MAAVAPEVSVIGATSLGGAAHRPEEASNHASGGRMYIPTGGGGRRCEAGCRGRKTGEDAQGVGTLRCDDSGLMRSWRQRPVQPHAATSVAAAGCRPPHAHD